MKIQMSPISRVYISAIRPTITPSFLATTTLFQAANYASGSRARERREAQIKKAEQNRKLQESVAGSDQSRITLKPVTSRKTFLIDLYKHISKDNEILLFVQHNNLIKQDSIRFSTEIKKAGANLTVIRNRLFRVFLRAENFDDPASIEAKEATKDVKHYLEPLLHGPTGIIAVKTCDPSVVAAVLKVLRTAGDKLILVGARIENSIYDAQKVNEFKDLPTKEQLQAQLAGLLTVLGGAGLVQTLEASSKVLYLTMDQHRKELDPNEKKEEEQN